MMMTKENSNQPEQEVGATSEASSEQQQRMLDVERNDDGTTHRVLTSKTM